MSSRKLSAITTDGESAMLCKFSGFITHRSFEKILLFGYVMKVFTTRVNLAVGQPNKAEKYGLLRLTCSKTASPSSCRALASAGGGVENAERPSRSNIIMQNSAAQGILKLVKGIPPVIV
ncbi:hypothetical protein RF11_10555 [Thelohanellus kitauei]|uniref:Uncharacterized protein n=1 Tax=Thelohanellus kitauei TaxID=669202 RepID=A0A0C2J495_THEKT|nr:hypothetical protein RF11_10555 [Thelohanellus kitauei]